MVRASNTLLNKNGESGHPCLVPDFSGKDLSFSPLSIVFALVFHKWLLLCYAPSIPTLVRVFIMNGCWVLSNAFSTSIEMIMWFLTFVNVVYDGN